MANRGFTTMKLMATAAVAFIATAAFASMPLPAPLDALARGADHILIGRVVGVDIVDEQCRAVTGPYARTGPGLTNTIRLHIAIDETVVTNAKTVPKLLKVPLDPFMHYSLEQIEEAHREPSEPFLILLSGPSFQPVIPGAILRSLDKKEEAVRIHRESHPNSRKNRRAAARSKPDKKKQVICN
jgi:hypothetical protein